MLGRNGNLGLLVGAILLSALGDWLALTALSLHLEKTTGSGAAVTALFVATWTPLVLVAGPAGWIADRFDARRVLVLSSVVQAAIALALAFVGGTVPILVLASLLAVANAVSQPAEFALIPAVVDESRISTANARVEIARATGGALGPLLGGLLFAAGGTALPLLVDAVSFLAIAVAGAAIALRVVGHGRDAKEPVGRAREGIVFLVRDDALRLVMIVAFVSLLFMTASAPAEVFFAIDVLDVGSTGFGALWSCWFVGMAVGGLTLASRVPRRALAGGALLAIVVQSLGLAIPALFPVFVLALASYVVGGSAHGVKNVLVRTLMHERVPARLHGRAFAAYNGLRNGAETVALVLGGVLVTTIGARWTLFLAGAAPAVAGAVGLAVHRRKSEAAERMVA